MRGGRTVRGGGDSVPAGRDHWLAERGGYWGGLWGFGYSTM